MSMFPWLAEALVPTRLIRGRTMKRLSCILIAFLLLLSVNSFAGPIITGQGGGGGSSLPSGSEGNILKYTYIR